MKSTILFFIVLNVTVFSSLGQHTAFSGSSRHYDLPKTNWKDFGFKKQVKQVGISHYKSDGTNHDYSFLEVHTFNKEGNIIQKYYRTFGKDGRESSTYYVYHNGKLDSIYYYLPKWNSCSEIQKLNYNNKGVLDSISTSEYTFHYTYEKSGKVSMIERKYPNRNRTSVQTLFNYEKNYVLENHISPQDGKITEYYSIYDGKELFASIIINRRVLVYFCNSYSRTIFEADLAVDALDFVLKLRALKDNNEEDFQNQLDELEKSSTSDIIIEIPIEDANTEGDWIKRLKIDRSEKKRELLFQILMYSDGTISGSTEFDFVFDKKVSHIK